MPPPAGAPQPQKSNKGLIIGCLAVGAVAIIGGIVAVVLLVVANSGPAHAADVVASCDMRTAGAGLCMDLTAVNDKVVQICSQYKFPKKACDRKGALGGCVANKTITWYYPDSSRKTAADVKKECHDDFVTTSWK
jgi:hypothetical protein